MKSKKFIHFVFLIVAVILVSFSAGGATNTLAQENPPDIWLVRRMEADHIGMQEPMGLVFSSKRNAFYALDGREWSRSSTSTDLIELTLPEDRAGPAQVVAAVQDPINIVYDNKAERLLILQAGANQVVEVPVDPGGGFAAETLVYHNINHAGLQDPQGITVDPITGDLFILDAAGPDIVRMAGSLESGRVSVLDLRPSGISMPFGIAFDPSTDHLYTISRSEDKLYELTQTGEVTAVRDLAPFDLKNIQGMVFAPSGDQTDDPGAMSLYVTDSGSPAATQEAAARPVPSGTGQIVELSLSTPAALPPGTTLLSAAPVNIIDTSNAAWNPSSPDPSGIDYWPLAGRLLIVDSEVDEMPNYFVGQNVYQSTTSGMLVSTCSTTSFLSEPTGVAINPNNNHIFISTDVNDRIFEVGLGVDGIYCTADDTFTITNILTLYGIDDAEDVAYGNNTLFIAGGTDAEVYRIPLGANGVLGGGDDGPMTHFDTAALGFHNLEGIGYNADNNTLLIVSTQGDENYLGETTTSGTFVRAYDLSFMGTMKNIRSDVTYAPSSQNPAVKNIYIASRGVDNDNDPNENDGKIWEINIFEPVPSFSDVPTNYWAWQQVERLYNAGITGGCGVNPLIYCPEGTVTRAQMAVFLERGMHGSSYTPPAVGGSTGFTDVAPTYWSAAWIKQLAVEGITGGCGSGVYCPESPVTRAQMAVFLLRAKHGSGYTPPAVGGSTGFSDVPPTYWSAAWIKQLVAEGITAGCGNGNYCPNAPVTRAQMAVFLVRTFNLP